MPSITHNESTTLWFIFFIVIRYLWHWHVEPFAHFIHSFHSATATAGSEAVRATATPHFNSLPRVNIDQCSIDFILLFFPTRFEKKMSAWKSLHRFAVTFVTSAICLKCVDIMCRLFECHEFGNEVCVRIRFFLLFSHWRPLVFVRAYLPHE